MQLLRFKKLPIWLNVLTAAFILTVFVLKPVHNAAFIALVLLGLAYSFTLLKNKQSFALTKEDKWFCYAVLFYIIVRLITFGFHDDRWRHVDVVSQLLAFLPTYFLLRKFKICLNALFIAIPCSAVIGFVVAAYDRLYLGLRLPFGNMIHIQAGDMALSLGWLSFPLFFYALKKKQKILTALCLLGILGGLGASVLSTARGGWISLPPVLLVLIYIFRQQLSKKFLAGLCTLVVVGAVVLFMIPQTQVSQRIHQAHSDIVNYFEKNNPNTSIGARFEMWKGALMIAQEHPLAGVGEDAFKTHFKRYATEGKMAKSASIYAHAHNLYLDSLAKNGIFGLLSLLLVFFVPLRKFWRTAKSADLNQKTIGALGVVHVVAVLFYGMSEAFFSLHATQMFYFFLAFVLYSMTESAQTESPK
ncbi:hypothetical protein CBG46_02630 [Actinobacillus succinogenes]|uniref:O-antigen polymerase n=1 Tax=Actinobacillus succinogenes (strain ATCC 55618 / DSM 22257 / CCUG 43843 / 130Z) TaxID=339671 RepID=A6VLR5_ACTSZ|nr:O-antigen ligase [Actinobacillus succinogenes]ABR73912.1 O-antigen polymerase [Actinobacillus succinogenes 130Z]PHI39640.1 hypothetical protein CBG46_02630 [Actinobacillus succinogenes]